MTQDRMAKNIRKRLKTEYQLDASKELVSDVLKLLDDEILMLIANNDSYTFSWATVYGEERAPRRMPGKFAEHKKILENHGYSFWKQGVPCIKWSKVALDTDYVPAEEYFNDVEHRYTSAAREFRQLAGFEEIPEFKDLPEEKVNEIIEKADKIAWEKIPYKKRKQILKDRKTNDVKTKGTREIWKQTGYVPMGAWALGYDGPTADTIDFTLKRTIYNEEVAATMNAAEKYRQMLYVEDLAKYKNQYDSHPEIDKLKNKFRKEMIEQGLEELPYEHFGFDSIQDFYINYDNDRDTVAMGQEIIQEQKEVQAQRFVNEKELQQTVQNLEGYTGPIVKEEEEEKALTYIDIDRILNNKYD